MGNPEMPATGLSLSGLFEVAYVSRSVGLLAEAELDRLLRTARGRNEELGITGMLLYRAQSFVQVLEGAEEHVRDVYERIRQDDRHFRVRTLVERPLAQRRFPDWSMGFRRLDDHAPPGHHGFLDGAVLDLREKDQSEAVELLYVFRSQA